jgi:hypothetical protein
LTPSEKARDSRCTSLSPRSENARSRGRSLRASYTVRKASGLTEEVVDAEANQVILASISGSGNGGSVSAERQRELLEQLAARKVGTQARRQSFGREVTKVF